MEGFIDTRVPATPKIHISFFQSFSDLISESETERVEYNNSTQAIWPGKKPKKNDFSIY